MVLPFKPRHRHLLGLLGAALIAGAVAGVAWSSIPGQDGVISACYAKSTGALRVVDESAPACKKNEMSLFWNQSGQQGEPGPGGGVPGAGFTQWSSGPGGANPDAIMLPEAPGQATIMTLDLPPDWVADSQGNWREGVTGLVATVTVMFDNRGDMMAHPGCTVLSDQGGFGDGHMYLSGRDQMGNSPTTGSMAFQAPSRPEAGGPPTQIWLTCSLGNDHPPVPMDVRVLRAEMTVVPRSF